MFNFDFLCWSSLMGTTVHAVASKRYDFSTNYHVCIAMPTWCRCAPPILFWPWPPFTGSMFPRSCLTWISSMMGTTLHAASRKSYAISTNYHVCIAMPTSHDVHVHIFCFDLDLHKFNLLLLRSCVATCPTSNWGCGTSLLRQELVLIKKIFNSDCFQIWRGTNDSWLPVAMPWVPWLKNYIMVAKGCPPV